MATSIEQMKELVQKLNAAAKAYYQEDREIMSNREYDILYDQLEQAEKFQKMENKLLPQNLDYTKIKGLRIEAAQKLEKLHPASVGQASRISGVSPADISVLLVYLKQGKR